MGVGGDDRALVVACLDGDEAAWTALVDKYKSLIFSVEDLIARISAVMTLLPGDLIATGTPAGVGSIEPGDKIEVRIEGIGSLTNPVIRLSA